MSSRRVGVCVSIFKDLSCWRYPESPVTQRRPIALQVGDATLGHSGTVLAKCVLLLETNPAGSTMWIFGEGEMSTR